MTGVVPGVVQTVVPMVVPLVRPGMSRGLSRWLSRWRGLSRWLCRWLSRWCGSGYYSINGFLFDFYCLVPFFPPSASVSIRSALGSSRLANKRGSPPTIHKSMSAPRHPVPVSDHPVSVSDSAGYGGSRKHKQRYEFSEYSRCGFAELSPSVVMTGEQLFDSLKKVPGVDRVHWNTPKAQQGNASTGHYMPANIMVYSKSGGSRTTNSPMEFEITRNQHSRHPDAPYTVTVMFKDPPSGLDAEAWRILRHVVRGKELLPDHVRQYMEKALARLDGQHAPGSATASSSQGMAWPFPGGFVPPSKAAHKSASAVRPAERPEDVHMAGGAVVPPPKAAPKSASAVRPAESPDDVHMAGGAGPGASPSAPAVPVHSVPGASQAAGPAVLPAAVSGAPTSVATQPGESTDVNMVDVAGAPGSASAPAPSSPVASKPSPPKKTKVEEQAAESAEGTRVPLVGQAAVSLEGGGAAGSATSPLTDVPLLQDAFSGEIEVDWECPSEDEEPRADAFEATAEFRAELEAELSGATEANIRAGAEHEAARADALPKYLQPERQQWREHSAELATVHAIKSREVEHVRYRCVADFPRDVDIQSVTHQMKVSARTYFHEFHGGAHLSELEGSPGSASDFGKTFLSEAHKRSLWVTNLENKGGSSDTEGFRTEYSKLLEDIPETAAQKFGESYLESPAARAHLLVGLLSWIATASDGSLKKCDQALPVLLLSPSCAVSGSAARAARPRADPSLNLATLIPTMKLGIG